MQSSYAPVSVPCPLDRPAIRPATSLSTEESAWLEVRGNNTLPALIGVLERANLTGIDVKSYIQDIAIPSGRLPRIGIALSGGGYRALMNGAGALAAFDDRTVNATGPGQLGGILQATTYLSALSGGSWLAGSLYLQNFTTVESIIDATEGFLSQLWMFNQTILQGRLHGQQNALYVEEEPSLTSYGIQAQNPMISTIVSSMMPSMSKRTLATTPLSPTFGGGLCHINSSTPLMEIPVRVSIRFVVLKPQLSDLRVQVRRSPRLPAV